MSVIPEKNGCNVWIDEYGCYVHGDSYHFPNGTLVIRTCPEKLPYPEGDKVHYRIPRVAHWFDEHQRYGVLICMGIWKYYGYEGVDESVFLGHPTERTEHGGR